MTEVSKCLECGSTLKGRADKKFCDDTCRSNYHNRLNKDSINLVRNINYRLRKNRRILADLNPYGKSKTKKDVLLKKGFDFNYHTSTYTTKAGKTYYFVYEQGYLPLEDGDIALVIKQEYIG